VYNIMWRCWIPREKRVKFWEADAELRALLKTEKETDDVRDVGAVLNGTYSALVRRMTVNASVMRRRKSTKTGPKGPTVPPPPPPVVKGGTAGSNKNADGAAPVDDNGGALGFEDGEVMASSAPSMLKISVADDASDNNDVSSWDFDNDTNSGNGSLPGGGNRRSIAVFEELHLSTDAKGERVRMRCVLST
jgi:hypothetical protein